LTLADSLVKYDDAIFPSTLRSCCSTSATTSRTNKVQLGCGNGPHTCVGIHLAKLEMQALLRAMVPRVEEIHTGTPERLLNNTPQGISRPTRTPT
jgi:cytochrome P450